jgi:tetraacyldisaccharide 4'-kinase
MQIFIACSFQKANMKRLDQYWYTQNPVAWLLLPLAGFYCLLAGLRFVLYKKGWLGCFKAGVPVIVVGNINVGGTGKTPLIIKLCEILQRKGLRPGIISRGYGSKSSIYPLEITGTTTSKDAGDEPLLLARRTGCPVIIGADREADINLLLERHGCNIILSDDGMQHYRMHRDVEIAVVDFTRKFGNGYCLPAGPLREPIKRLRTVDMVIANGGLESQLSFTIKAAKLISLAEDNRFSALSQFAGKKVHAVAGIGHPQRFFNMLAAQGIEYIPHVFPDHHVYEINDLHFGDELPVLMTEKDAVKCAGFYMPRHWYLPIDIELSAIALQRIEHLIEQVCHG